MRDNRLWLAEDRGIPLHLLEDLSASTHRRTWRPWRHFRSNHKTTSYIQIRDTAFTCAQVCHFR